jgi:hypothetical protein
LWEGCATTICCINIGIENAARFICATDRAWFTRTTRVAASAAVIIVVICVVVPLVNTSAAEVFALDNPDKFFDWVVEVKFNLNVYVGGRFITSKL